MSSLPSQIISVSQIGFPFATMSKSLTVLLEDLTIGF